MNIFKIAMLVAGFLVFSTSVSSAAWVKVSTAYCGVNTFTLRSNIVEDITTSDYDTAIHYLETHFLGQANIYARDDSWGCNWIPTREFYGWQALKPDPYYARPVNPPRRTLRPRHDLDNIIPRAMIPFINEMFKALNHKYRSCSPPHSHPYGWGRCDYRGW